MTGAGARVLVAEPLSETGLAVISAAGLAADVSTDLSREQLLAAIGEYDALVVRSGTKVDRELLTAGKKLRVVGRAGVGLDSERALKLAVAEMYLQGVSTRKATAVIEQLCGFEVTRTQVSRAVQRLDEELTRWRERPLGKIEYLLLDARYEKVRVGGSVASCALLVAVGITPEGRRTILGVSVSLSEAEVHWREFLASLQVRGLHGVRLLTSDDHAGLAEARQARFPGVPWQRCQFHLAENMLQYVPPSLSQEEVSGDLVRCSTP